MLEIFSNHVSRNNIIAKHLKQEPVSVIGIYDEDGYCCWCNPESCRKCLTWIHKNRCDHDDAIKWKLYPRYWPFVRGIHRSPVDSPHKGQWRRALTFSLIWMSEQSRRWWLKTPSRLLWRHCNADLRYVLYICTIARGLIFGFTSCGTPVHHLLTVHLGNEWVIKSIVLYML